MTEATTHGDFLELLKLKTEIYQLKKENEQLKASSPIECARGITLLQEVLPYIKDKADAEENTFNQEGIVLGYDEKPQIIYEAIKEYLNSAALPLPVESGWNGYDWEQLKTKLIDILEEANGTGSGAIDIIDYLQSIKNQSIK